MTKETFSVLFLDDLVVLPGMTVPLELTPQAQATLDAARADAGASREPLRVLLVPRIDDHSGSMGTVAEVSQVTGSQIARDVGGMLDAVTWRKLS